MSTRAAATQTTKAAPLPITRAGPSLALQRQCACGGSAGLTRTCSECRKNTLLDNPLQTKLRINEPGDQYEQEADQVAERVMRISATDLNGQHRPSQSPLVQRQMANGRTGVMEAPSSVYDVVNSSGQPLDISTRAFFESRFGHDFSRVRVHTGAQAEQSALDVNAHAYTVGRDIVFGAGQFTPGSLEGRRLLAHELTHVLQQSGMEYLAAGQGGHRLGVLHTPEGRMMQKEEAATPSAPKEEKAAKSQLSLQLNEPDFLGLKKPFFQRNALHLWDSASAAGVWRYNFDFFKRFGISNDWAGKAANLTAPLAIDSQLKAGNPTWWEITDKELGTTSIVAPIPIIEFDAKFREWRPLPFLRK